MSERHRPTVIDQVELAADLHDKMADEGGKNPSLSRQKLKKSFTERAKDFFHAYRRKPVSSEVHQQSGSPLFAKLPQEIRDSIWRFVLAPGDSPRSAHFHVYDEVYDSCNYTDHRSDVGQLRGERRQAQEHIAILMTCRAAYNEAVHYLYNDTKFTLAVFAGLPRPWKGNHPCRKSLGPMKKCEPIFRRIRHLTLIIQPGKNPLVEAYTTRLKALLEALQYGKKFKSLTIIFNYRVEMHTLDPEHTRRNAVLSALYPLQPHVGPRVRCGKCKLRILVWYPGPDHEQPTKDLALALCGVDTNDPASVCDCCGKAATIVRSAKVIAFNPTKPADKQRAVKYGADLACLDRGAFGENFAAIRVPPSTPVNSWFVPQRVSKEDLEMLAIAGVFLATWPVSFPVAAYSIWRRKRLKGEWK